MERLRITGEHCSLGRAAVGGEALSVPLPNSAIPSRSWSFAIAEARHSESVRDDACRAGERWTQSAFASSRRYDAPGARQRALGNGIFADGDVTRFRGYDMRMRRLVVRGVSVMVMGAAMLVPGKPAAAAPEPCPVGQVFCASSCATICPISCYQQDCWVMDCYESGEWRSHWIECEL